MNIDELSEELSIFNSGYEKEINKAIKQHTNGFYKKRYRNEEAIESLNILLKNDPNDALTISLKKDIKEAIKNNIGQLLKLINKVNDIKKNRSRFSKLFIRTSKFEKEFNNIKKNITDICQKDFGININNNLFSSSVNQTFSFDEMESYKNGILNVLIHNKSNEHNFIKSLEYYYKLNEQFQKKLNRLSKKTKVSTRSNKKYHKAWEEYKNKLEKHLETTHGITINRLNLTAEQNIILPNDRNIQFNNDTGNNPSFIIISNSSNRQNYGNSVPNNNVLTEGEQHASPPNTDSPQTKDKGKKRESIAKSTNENTPNDNKVLDQETINLYLKACKNLDVSETTPNLPLPQNNQRVNPTKYINDMQSRPYTKTPPKPKPTPNVPSSPPKWPKRTSSLSSTPQQ